MSSPYSTDLPGKHENTARWIRNNRPTDTLYWVRCAGIRCDECLSKDLYTVCPTCAASLIASRRPYQCSCGTTLWVCNRTNVMASVTRYTVPSYLFTVEEDVI